MIDPQIKNTYALISSPDDFLRESAELFARCDNAWKAAFNRHDLSIPTLAAFVASGLVHLDALALCHLDDEAIMAMASMLLSVDMTKIDCDALGDDFIRLHIRFFKGCCQLKRNSVDDPFALPHAEEILRHEAALFIDATANVTNPSPEIIGLRTAAQGLVGDRKPDFESLDRPQLLVDIFARLHAILS